MRVESNSLMSELQALQGEMRSNMQRPVTVDQALQELSNGQGVQELSQTSNNFGQLFSDALNKVNGQQQEANSLRTRFDLGDRSVGIGDVMIAGQKSSVAFEATVQVRNKLVEAYKEVMSMPV
ncbi:flagellar hook-basal body complex protein FliE [Alginatibacterium sediminis]|uniref:Flagellar hook-basal body complex protein FliE n=1 Tax=Alginatibacterium sediminis TaxID=2164068 RepID=A0A420EFK3_9ALTE|nr:flagellar hook-basal body complex protein FliE [Alginatibacterium sediminis]RKF19479.1 flagellar hook-basal body complex protein FliE [Alginatibacterium sediminis]